MTEKKNTVWSQIEQGMATKDMNIKELADACGISRQTLHNIKKGSGVKIETLKTIMNALGIELKFYSK